MFLPQLINYNVAFLLLLLWYFIAAVVFEHSGLKILVLLSKLSLWEKKKMNGQKPGLE